MTFFHFGGKCCHQKIIIIALETNQIEMFFYWFGPRSKPSIIKSIFFQGLLKKKKQVLNVKSSLFIKLMPQLAQNRSTLLNQNWSICNTVFFWKSTPFLYELFVIRHSKNYHFFDVTPLLKAKIRNLPSSVKGMTQHLCFQREF